MSETTGVDTAFSYFYDATTKRLAAVVRMINVEDRCIGAVAGTSAPRSCFFESPCCSFGNETVLKCDSGPGVHFGDASID